jgi:hypothetical protein
MNSPKTLSSNYDGRIFFCPRTIPPFAPKNVPKIGDDPRIARNFAAALRRKAGPRGIIDNTF